MFVSAKLNPGQTWPNDNNRYLVTDLQYGGIWPPQLRGTPYELYRGLFGLLVTKANPIMAQTTSAIRVTVGPVYISAWRLPNPDAGAIGDYKIFYANSGGQRFPAAGASEQYMVTNHLGFRSGVLVDGVRPEFYIYGLVATASNPIVSTDSSTSNQAALTLVRIK